MPGRARPGIAALLALLAVAIAGAAPAAQATFRGANGKIAFVSDRDGNSEVYLMNADGTNQRNLTQDPAADGQTAASLTDPATWDGPSFSPDGERIAFTSTRSGNQDIWVFDLEADEATRLTDSTAPDYNPAFTPDGDIVFVSERGRTGRNLWRMEADGTAQTQVPNSANLTQPDAMSVAPSEALAVTKPATSQVASFVIQPGPPDVFHSPDITPAFQPEFGHEASGSASNFFSARQPGGTLDLYRTDAPMAGFTNITQTHNLDELDPALPPSGHVELLAYVVPNPDHEIFVGSNQITFNNASDTAPEWQPLDKTPPFTQLESGPTGDADGTEPYVTRDRTPTFTFTSPDAGSFRCSIDEGVAYFADCNGPSGSHTPSASLADGTYTFRVRAVDDAGNVDLDGATRTFTVDTQGPTVTLTKSPKRKLRTSKSRVTVAFEWTASEPGSTFECSLDDGPAEPCDSGASYRVRRGAHTFEITATDFAGNEGQPLSYSFKVLKK